MQGVWCPSSTPSFLCCFVLVCTCMCVYGDGYLLMHVWSPGDIRRPLLPLFALNSIPRWTCCTDWLAREPRGHFCLHPSGLEWQSRAVMSCCLHGYWGSRLRSSWLVSKCFTLCQFLGPLRYCSLINSSTHFCNTGNQSHGLEYSRQLCFLWVTPKLPNPSAPNLHRLWVMPAQQPP